jgi:hypothetical protein
MMGHLFRPAISADFVRRHIVLTIPEILYGARAGILAPGAEVALAGSRFEAEPDPSVELYELANASPGPVSMGMLFDLASKYPTQPQEELIDVWTYLSLLWIEENWTQLEKPHFELDCFIADLEYPEPLYSELYSKCENPADPGEAAWIRARVRAAAMRTRRRIPARDPGVCPYCDDLGRKVGN